MGMSAVKPCYVYMIEMDAPVYGRPPGHLIFKVGISVDADRRFAAFQTGSPFRLRMVDNWRLPHEAAARVVESEFHKAFKKHKMNGEWFCWVEAGARCSVEAIIAEYWHMCWGAHGLFNFLVSTGMNERHAADVCLANYGEVG
jgi:hypothetical protein